MKTLQTFHGSLSRGFTGNIIFQFHIPDEIHELSVELTYEKEHLEDPVSYIECFRHQLIRQAMPYLGRIPTDRQLLEMTQSMKTELQLCILIDGTFVGNVHMPGTKKKILLKEGLYSRGCLPYKGQNGMLKIIVNVYQVIENNTPWTLEIKGGTEDVDMN